MAHPEHLKILQQGVAVWNAWRRQHPDIKPNLAGVSLAGKDLMGANFRATTFIKTDFLYFGIGFT